MDNIKLTKFTNCGGWGAKVSAGTLKNLLKDFKKFNNKNLIVGFDNNDDASVYKISDDVAVIESVDFFPPIVDDPYIYGQIAVANSISDIYAMGGTPTTALNILCIKSDINEDVIREILKGGFDKAYEAEITIAGGHTINGDEFLYGLSVSGIVNPKKILSNSSAKVGDKLILTKKLGIGIITTALKGGLVSKTLEDEICKQMSTLNKYSFDIAKKYKINSLTDVTGFSLVGHAYEMAKGSNVCINIDSNNLIYFDNAINFANMGLIPAGNKRNKEFTDGNVKINDKITQSIIDICYSPETSGGLLISIDKNDAINCINEMKKNRIDASIVGEVVEYNNTYVNLI